MLTAPFGGASVEQRSPSTQQLHSSTARPGMPKTVGHECYISKGQLSPAESANRFSQMA